MRNFKCEHIAVGTVLLALSGGAFAQESCPSSTTAVTTAECESAWQWTQADAVCNEWHISAEPSAPGESVATRCSVKAYCPMVDQEGQSVQNLTDFHGSPAYVKDLVNCSGWLKTARRCQSPTGFC